MHFCGCRIRKSDDGAIPESGGRATQAPYVSAHPPSIITTVSRQTSCRKGQSPTTRVWGLGAFFFPSPMSARIEYVLDLTRDWRCQGIGMNRRQANNRRQYWPPRVGMVPCVPARMDPALSCVSHELLVLVSLGGRGKCP